MRTSDNGKHDKNRITVVHFLGAGRSGSTLLNIMLGNHGQILGAGELLFLARAWRNGDYCSCEQPLKSCPFWSMVLHQWLQRTAISDLSEYIVLQQEFERYRKLPRYFFSSITSSPEFQKYSAYTSQLFQVIHELSGAPIIVDSSKNPARVLSLAGIPEIDLRVVFLVRDVRGYSWSKRKPFRKEQKGGLGWNVKPYPVWKSAVEWAFINLISEWTLKKVGRSVFVRYEDLIHRPESTIARIGNLVDLDLSSLAAFLESGSAFTVDHVATGNRLRMNKEIRLQRGEAWKVSMPPTEQTLSITLAGWLMRRYGYSGQGTDG